MNYLIVLIFVFSSNSFCEEIPSILKKMKLQSNIQSESAHLHVETKTINSKNNSEVINKDEYYNFYFKNYKKRRVFLFQDEDNVNAKLKITTFGDDGMKKERYVKNKGYQLIASDNESRNLWGIDVDDLDFSKYNEDNFNFSKLKKMTKCSGRNNEAAYILKGIPKGKKNYKSVLLTVSTKSYLICQANFYRDSKSIYKKLVVSKFRSEGKIFRPSTIKITEKVSAIESFSALINYNRFELNQVRDNIFK